jgi:C-terminal peptidase prc
MTGSLRFVRTLAAAGLLGIAAGICPAAGAAITDELLAPLTAAYLRSVAPGEEAHHYRELLGTVLRQVERNFAREVDAPALIAAAVRALESLEPGSGEPAAVFARAVNAALASLDPHSRYLDPRAESAQRSAMRGSYSGLGLQVEMVDGLLRIVAPMPGTPAARAGLLSGDLILRFDDQPVQGMTLEEAVSRMRGEPGTAIVLTIRRPGVEDPLVVPLVREVIRREAVRWSMEEGVLVLGIASFNGPVAAALEKAIAEASARENPRAVVLDLRGNGGGLLRQALITADAFLAQGEIVSLRGRTAANQRSWQADANESLAGVPMVLLVDGRTASAAELVAAALQENGRATILGQRSFGKGTVQSLIPLGEGNGALRLTTALYHGPSGRSVQLTGVVPDVELLLPGAAPVSGPRRAGAAPQALPGTGEPPPPRARIEAPRCARARKDLDPVLACALAFVEAGGIEAFVSAFAASGAP